METTHTAPLDQRRRGWPAAYFSRRRLGALLDRAFAIDRLLTLTGLVLLATLAATLVGLVVDPRSSPACPPG